jgi:hypothetical protein
MRTSTAFKKVLETFEGNSPYLYICHAIEDTEIPYLVKEGLKLIVEDLLYPADCLDEWLDIYHPNLRHTLYKYHIFNESAYDKKLHETRVAWLKHLIKHYESLGN